MVLLLGLFGVIVNAIAWRKGFYTTEPQPTWGFKRISLKHVVAIFAIYLSTSFFFPALIATVAPVQAMQKLSGLTWIQSLTIISTLLLLYLYCTTLSSMDMKTMWKARLNKETPSIITDFIFGALCWFWSSP